MLNKPNFIIVGVARCGTTSLFYYLKQHPEILFSKIKEPKYFSSVNRIFPHRGRGDKNIDSEIIKGFYDYISLFKQDTKSKVVGEASSDYFYYHKDTIPEIKKILGDVKILICLRDPITRAFSAYNNLLRDSREHLSFEKGLNAENKRILDNYDWMWAYKYGSLYSKGVKDFKKNFSHVKIILFEDFIDKTKDQLRDICTFLDVDSSFDFETTNIYSPSGFTDNFFLKIFLRRSGLFFYMRKFLISTLGREFLEKIYSKFLKKEEIKKETIDELKSFFKEDIILLEKIIERDLTIWPSKT